jgi:partner of Y14 and mago protein
MPTTATKSTTKAGIAETETGDRHIPSSLRPDGTLRKEIRVRPGYRPPEDVEVYQNRTAAAWKSRGSGGVPGAEYIEKKLPNHTQKSVKPKTAGKDSGSTTMDKPASAPAPEVKQEESVDPEVEKEKEAKKLSKRLRQARELQQKKEEGGALLPEQFQKVIKINELIRQLEKLGFDTEGNKKS